MDSAFRKKEALELFLRRGIKRTVALYRKGRSTPGSRWTQRPARKTADLAYGATATATKFHTAPLADIAAFGCANKSQRLTMTRGRIRGTAGTK